MLRTRERFTSEWLCLTVSFLEVSPNDGALTPDSEIVEIGVQNHGPARLRPLHC